MEEEENKLELYSKLSSARLTIKKLKRELESVKVNWSLFIFGLIEKELYNFDIKLNSYPIKIKASYSNKPVLYEVNVNDIVAIVSDQRNKNVYLVKELKNIEGKLHKTNKITVNRNNLTLKKLCSEIDSLQFHLVQVSKNVCINLKYYSTDWKKVYLDNSINNFYKLKKITIGKPYLINYRLKHKNFQETISLHSLMSQYKEKQQKLI